MLHLLDDSLETFLRAEVPLAAREVDISFDAPDKDWGASVSRPTVNLYLWDVRRNTEDRGSGMELVEDDEGRKHRRPPLPRIDCRYLVTAWTSELRDEHALLGAVLETLLISSTIAADYLQGLYAPVRPLPSLSVAAADSRDHSDFWSALGGQLKPGLDLLVTATVDAAVLAAAGPPVDRYEIVFRDRTDGTPMARSLRVGGQAPGQAGVAVQSPRGRATVRADGSFVLRADPGDDVVLRGEAAARSQVPPAGRMLLGEDR